MRRRCALLLLLGASLPGGSPARADASLDVPAGRCAAALAAAADRFVAESGAVREGLDIDAGGARVTYHVTDMCGFYDDYRGSISDDGRPRFRIIEDDGGHAADFKRAFRPAFRLCAASR